MGPAFDLIALEIEVFCNKMDGGWASERLNPQSLLGGAYCDFAFTLLDPEKFPNPPISMRFSD